MSYEVAIADEAPIIRIMQKAQRKADRFAHARAVQAELREQRLTDSQVSLLLGAEREGHRLTQAALERANVVIACIQKALREGGYKVKDDLDLYATVARLIRDRDAAISHARGSDDVIQQLNRKLQCPTST